MELNSIGRRIQFYRKNRNLTQEVFSEKVHLTPHYLSAVERGVKLPSLETLVLIINELQVSADDILMDVLHVSNEIKASRLYERIQKLPAQEQARIFELLEVMLKDQK